MLFSGVEVYGEFKDGKFNLRSIDLNEALAKLQSNRESIPESEGDLPPIFPGELEVRNAAIIFEIDDRAYRMPFEIMVAPEKEDYNRFNLTVLLYPLGESVHAEASIDLKQQDINLKLAAASLDLNRFTGLVQTVSDLMLSGKLDLKATAHLKLAPFKISSLDASAELQNCKIRFDDLLLQNVRSSDPKELPIKINLSKITADDWNVSGSAISATSPLPFTLSDWHGRIRVNGKQVESTGEFNLALLPSSVYKNNLLPVEVSASLPLHGSYTAEYREGGSLQFSITNTPSKQSKEPAARFKLDHYEITAGMPAIDISGKGKLEDLSTAYAISVPKVMIASQKKTIHLPQVVLRGTADLGKNGNVFAEATFKLQSPNTRILLSPARINITDVTISGQVKTNINGAINLGGLLQFTGAGVTVPETGVKISGARGVIPLKWPPGKHMKTGDISIGAVGYRLV